MDYENLYRNIFSYENLYLAYKKARKGKTRKDYVKLFETNLKENLLNLQNELIFHYYKPKPLVNFTVRDPKTRKISKSDFGDRVVHHALVNILEPIYEKIFIYDSYASRKNKGTHKAIKRFDKFKRKVSRNNHKKCYILKCDIKKYKHGEINKDKILEIYQGWQAYSKWANTYKLRKNIYGKLKD